MFKKKSKAKSVSCDMCEKISPVAIVVLGLAVILNSIYATIEWSLLIGVAIALWGVLGLLKR